MRYIFLLLIFLSQALAKVEDGLYKYEPEPFFGEIRWEQVVPLFKILLPYLLIVGLPILVVLSFLLVIKITKCGFGTVWDLLKEFFVRKERKNER